MNIWHNNYKRLKQENDDAISEMTEKNYAVLQEMTDYISSHPISLFEKEVLRKDLIGVCLEADKEDVAVLAKLGVPPKEFCDSLLAESSTANLFELVIFQVQDVLFWLFLLYSFKFALTGFSKDFILDISTVLLAVVCSSVPDCMDILWKKRIFANKKKKQMYQVISGVIPLISFLLVLIIPDSVVLFYGNGGNGRLIWVVLFLITAAVFLGNNYYWNTVSKRYNWE